MTVLLRNRRAVALAQRSVRLLRRTAWKMDCWIEGRPTMPEERAAPPPQSPRPPNTHLALVAGHFSYRYRRSTFGDTEALRVVLDWLESAGIPYDVASDPANGINGLDLDALDPRPYTIFIFVCGPWTGDPELLARFAHCRRIGINLSVEPDVDHGFDILLPRDRLEVQNPDLAFLSRAPNPPLVGVALVHKQPEYGERQCHSRVGQLIDSYLHRGEVVGIPLNTLSFQNPTSLTNAVQFENLVRRLDAVITTRLHGLVFALKNGVPAVAIDAVAGGAKVTAQARGLEWPLIFDGAKVSEEEIRDAVARCVSGGMKDVVMRVNGAVPPKLNGLRADFLKALATNRPSKI